MERAQTMSTHEHDHFVATEKNAQGKKAVVLRVVFRWRRHRRRRRLPRFRRCDAATLKPYANA